MPLIRMAACDGYTTIFIFVRVLVATKNCSLEVFFVSTVHMGFRRLIMLYKRLAAERDEGESLSSAAGSLVKMLFWVSTPVIRGTT
jgi:hypothetical protein